MPRKTRSLNLGVDSAVQSCLCNNCTLYLLAICVSCLHGKVPKAEDEEAVEVAPKKKKKKKTQAGLIKPFFLAVQFLCAI